MIALRQRRPVEHGFNIYLGIGIHEAHKCGFTSKIATNITVRTLRVGTEFP